MSESNKAEAEKRARISELDRQIEIRKTALAMDIPPSLLQNGRTPEEIEQIARDALAWRGAPSPGSATAAVSPSHAPHNGSGQYNRSMLPHLGPEGVMDAYRAGRLAAPAAAAPPPHHTGEQHRNSGPQ